MDLDDANPLVGRDRFGLDQGEGHASIDRQTLPTARDANPLVVTAPPTARVDANPLGYLTHPGMHIPPHAYIPSIRILSGKFELGSHFILQIFRHMCSVN